MLVLDTFRKLQSLNTYSERDELNGLLYLVSFENILEEWFVRICTMQNNGGNSGTVKKKKYIQQLHSTFIRIFVLGKLDIFKDFKMLVVKLD